MAKKSAKRKAATTAIVRANIRADIVSALASIRKRVFHNASGFTSEQISAEIGTTHYASVTAFLAAGDALVTDLTTSGQ